MEQAMPWPIKALWLDVGHGLPQKLGHVANDVAVSSYLKGAWIFLGIFFVFFWDFFCFPVWLAFPCVFHWFSFIFLTCPLFSIDFPCFSLVFHWFYFNFLIFPLFSIGFPWFSLVFLVFPLFCLHFLTFPLFCFVSLRFHWFDCIFIISLRFFTSIFFHVFLLLVFSMFFWFYTAFSSLFCCFYLGYVSLVFLFHWFSYIFLYIMVFSCIGIFVHCPHSFLLQLMWLVLVVVVVGGGGGCCCFGAFMYFLWADGWKPLWLCLSMMLLSCCRYMK